MPKKSKNIYSKYQHNELIQAVHKVRNKEMSLRKAASIYKVPRSTISDRVTGKIDDVALPGRPPILSQEVEDNLYKITIGASQKGLGLSRRQLMQKVGRIAQKQQVKTPFKNGVAGKDWLMGFRRRHNDLTLRSPAKLSNARCKLSEETTREYFLQLGAVLQSSKVSSRPSSIWNMDETGISIEHKPKKVVARRGARTIPGRVSSCRDNITVVACVNASGISMPPMCIVKGKTRKSLLAYNTDEGPEGTIWTFQQNAWMEDVLGEIWFRDVFLANCGPARPQLLILDQHRSHEVTGLLEAALSENIIIFALPPHSSQWLQPLDKGVFGPLMGHYNTVCSEFTSETAQVVMKCVWPKLFKTAWELGVTTANIKSGFKTTGIHPFNPQAIPSLAYQPSTTATQQTSPSLVQAATATHLQSESPVQAASATHLQSPIQVASATHLRLPVQAASETHLQSPVQAASATHLQSPVQAASATHLQSPVQAAPATHLQSPVQAASATHLQSPVQAASATHLQSLVQAASATHLQSTSQAPGMSLSATNLLHLQRTSPTPLPASSATQTTSSPSWDTRPLLPLEAVIMDVDEDIARLLSPMAVDIPINPDYNGQSLSVQIEVEKHEMSTSSSGCRLLTSSEVIAMKKAKDLEKEVKKAAAVARKKKKEAKQQAELLQRLIEGLSSKN